MKSLNKDVADLVRSPLGSASEPSISFTGDPNTGIFSPGADQLAASTGGSERLRITSAGLVGIGTSAPSDMLHINGGQIRIQRDVPQILFRSGDGTSNQYYIGANISNAVDGGFVIGEGPGITGGTPRIAISSAGNVGIGTASPGGKLQISESFTVAATKDLLRLQSESAVDGCVMRVGGYAYTGNARSAIDFVQNGGTNFQSQLVFSTSAGADATERARIDSSGRFGLGVSSPTSLLHLADAGNIQVGTTTGTKIGTATTQKLGFYNATPVVQPTAVANATDAASVITQLNDLLAKLRTLGIIAT